MAKVTDLMKITGKGRQAVTTAIDNGDLPGYRMGNGIIWIPEQALEEVKRGTWIPPKKRKEWGIGSIDFLHKRSGA